MELNRYKEAIAEFRKESVQNPSDDFVIALIALCYYNLEDFSSSKKVATHAITINPKSDLAHYILGEILVGEKQFEEANIHLSVALSEDPRNEDYLVGLGKSHLLNGDYLLGEEYIDKALAINPQYHKALMIKALLLERKDKNASAVSIANRLLEIAPLDASSFKVAATINKSIGQLSKAKALQFEAIKADPTNEQEIHTYINFQLLSNPVIQLLYSESFLLPNTSNFVIVVSNIAVNFIAMMSMFAVGHPYFDVLVLVVLIVYIIYTIAPELYKLYLYYKLTSRFQLLMNWHDYRDFTTVLVSTICFAVYTITRIDFIFSIGAFLAFYGTFAMIHFLIIDKLTNISLLKKMSLVLIILSYLIGMINFVISILDIKTRILSQTLFIGMLVILIFQFFCFDIDERKNKK